MKSVSIVIRGLNEEASLRKLFPILQSQDFDGEVQTVFVDNESSDKSVEVAKSFGADVVSLARKEFSYPKATNLGIAAVKHEIVIIMSAHSYPFNTDWLASGVSHFDNAQIAGVYANVIPRDGATVEERDFYMPGYLAAKARGPHAVEKGTMGTLGATNCIIRRSLWEQHPFDESYGAGGEDGEWAQWAMDQGYKIINDYRFSVKHSHKIKGDDLKKQIEYWQGLGGPQPFDSDKLKFRDDITFD